MTETIAFLATAPTGAARTGARPRVDAVPRSRPRSYGAAASGRRPAARCASPARRTARARARFQRRRLVAVLLGVAIVLTAGRAASAALGGEPLAASERPSTPATQITSTVVRPGDSLWVIAQRLVPGGDPRPVVDALAEARRGAPLIPGETIHWYR